MSIQPSGIYHGTVFHERHTPFNHKFTYRVFTLWLDIDRLTEFDQSFKLFSFNRPNVISIHNKDHALRDGSSIRPWIEQAGKEKNIDLSKAKIFMLCFPRIWNYVFNPITVFFCYDKDENLIAVLHQVKNTFGEQHGYFLPVKNYSQNKNVKQHCGKIFHVSPFIHMDCEYRFRFKNPGDELHFAIHQFQTKPDDQSKILTATWDGKYIPLTNAHLWKSVLKHPLLSFKVIAGIHFEALRLVMKGARYISKPKPPKKSVT